MAEENTGDSVEPGNTPPDTGGANTPPADGGTDDLLNTQGNTDDGQQDPGDGGEGDTKNAEGNKEPEGAPDEYAEFSTPDGIEIDAELLAAANPLMKELGLSQTQAQKLVDFQSAQVQAQVEGFQQQIETWQEEVKADAEIGGEHLQQSLTMANAAIDTYFKPEFRAALRKVGLTNHPEVIRGMRLIAQKHLSEDNPGGGNPPHKEKSRAEKLYGTE